MERSIVLKSEVRLELAKMRRNKATGLDVIIIEMLKYGINELYNCKNIYCNVDCIL